MIDINASDSRKTRGLEVLIVEDDDLFRALVRSIFEHERWFVREAIHGRHALDVLRAGAKPDLILTDLNMPELDGISFIEELPTVKGLDNTIVVVCTTLELKPEEQSRIGYRAHILIRKGQFTPLALATELRNIAAAVTSIRSAQSTPSQ